MSSAPRNPNPGRGPDGDELSPIEADPVVLEFPEPGARAADRSEAAPADPPANTPRGLDGLLAFVLPAALLSAACLPLLFILRRPAGLVGWVGGLALTVGLLWIVTSVLWPGRAERGCPDCGEDALERLDPETTRGVRCRECGWSDPSRSSWLLAEEEGEPLEAGVLRDRGRLPPLGPDSNVDTDRSTD